MRKNELKKLKTNLEDKQMQLAERLSELHKEKTRETNPLSRSNEEDNSQIFSADLLVDILDAKDYKEYNMVKVALKKIRSGDYGICEECDVKIGVNRLLALPFAKFCIECAEDLEMLKTKKL